MRNKGGLVVLLIGILMMVYALVDQAGLGRKLTMIRDDRGDKSEIYRLLDESIRRPDSPIDGRLSKTISFTALMVSDPYNIDFEEGDGSRSYQTAMIARNAKDVFLVDVTDTESFKKGELVTITGKVKGLIYSTVENERREYLDIVAKKLEVKELNNTRPEPSRVRETNNGKIRIEEAFGVRSRKSKDLVGLRKKDVVTLYFEHENTGGLDSSPRFSDLGRIYLGDYLLGRSPLIAGKKIRPDGDRLDITIEKGQKTYSGKKESYSIDLSPIDDEVRIDLSKPLVFESYDDDFNLTDYYELKINIVDEDDERVE